MHIALRIAGILSGAGLIWLATSIIQAGYASDDFLRIVFDWILGGIVGLIGVAAAIYMFISLICFGNEPADWRD